MNDIGIKENRMKKLLFNISIKVLWLVLAFIALFTFKSYSIPLNRYDFEFKGRYIYRFDKHKGVLAKSDIPKEGLNYYSFEEDGHLVTVSFQESRSEDLNLEEALEVSKAENDKLNIFKKNKKNFKKVTLKFVDIVE